MERIWKDITGYNGKYQVSNDGLVKSTVGNEKLLKVEETARGYYRVELCDCTGKRNRHKHFIHKLIYQEFVGDIPEGKQIDHIDTNPKNNSIDNLRCVTPKENINNPLTREHIKKIRESEEYRKKRKEIANTEQFKKRVSEAKSKITGIEKDNITYYFKKRKDAANYLGVSDQTISSAISRNSKINGWTIISKG
ncbi:MAG: NUMOD4 motif-containing HNH endonuclease [Lachnospiraceae bacterium]|nr:NUMOD4 motif-containing HNH endonuclease [Lachnospiraceae bacterium]